MDRAHRMGQRRAVSVFRLLVEGSLEQRILGLQGFKLGVASAVVGADSLAQDSLDGGRLLDVLAGPQVRPAGWRSAVAARSSLCACAACLVGWASGRWLAAVHAAALRLRVRQLGVVRGLTGHRSTLPAADFWLVVSDMLTPACMPVECALGCNSWKVA